MHTHVEFGIATYYVGDMYDSLMVFTHSKETDMLMTVMLIIALVTIMYVGCAVLDYLIDL